VFGFVIAALFTLSGIGNTFLSKFHNASAAEIATKLEGGSVRVQSELASVFGGAAGHLKSVTISAEGFKTQGLPLFTEPERTKRGKIDALNIQLKDFYLKKLRISALNATIPDCRYDYVLATRKYQFRLSKSGEGTGTVKILQEDLSAFILAKFPEIKRVQVKADNDKVWVSGYGEFLLLTTNFELVARLESRDARTLELVDVRIWFDGNRASDAAAQPLLKTLNPVVDLDADLELHGALDVTKIQCKDGVITVDGKTRIPVAKSPQDR
jgi:hypothetical protein